MTAAGRPAVAPSLRRAEAHGRVRRIALVALLIIGPLLAGEIGMRLLVAFDRLPVAVAHLDQFEMMWTNLHRRDDWDVLLLGDSTTQEGISPAVIEEIIGGELGREVRVFDGAVPGSKLALNLAITRQLVAEDRLPPVVMLGIQAGVLAGSPQFRDFFLKTPMGRIATACDYEVGYNDAVSCRLEQVSMLWRMRGQLPTIIEAIARPMPASLRGRASILGPDGYRASFGTTAEKLELELDRRTRRGQLHDWNLRSGIVANFTAFVSYLRDHGATVVAVVIPNNPPLADRFESLYPGWASRYDASLDALERAAEIAIARPQIANWFKPSDAHNLKHFSEEGAAKFTRQFLSIGWVRSAIAGGVDGATAAGVR
ncbi:MAG TPA: hypothetical protein VES36_11235 [Candidatus Limnocylindrales bacterium]|nr:hypothetical protein [Candidatus Limnocylindrales bacterium]